ncbi:hypothetical protein [Sphaerimonospora mesophila]|uniref:hypothetical protein n=1 Tax=Sphaerimonospora mesophila TaxID=37483 RepID=UPI0006E1D007
MGALPLGGNATAIGASADAVGLVLVLVLAERGGDRIGFCRFTGYGLVVTVITVAPAVPYLWPRYLT